LKWLTVSFLASSYKTQSGKGNNVAAIVYPQTTTDYQTGGKQYENTKKPGIFNSFLDAIDGSYCTYTYGNETGDDPDIDPQDPGGKHDCGTLKPTNVISLSYGWYENHYPLNYMIRQCNEFMKLALQGVTVVAASGDAGVTGNGQCLGPGFNITSPTFPSCPYITLVGATELMPGNSPSYPERAVSTRLTSGGGFSNVFPQPSYQANAVNSSVYLQTHFETSLLSHYRFLTNHKPPFPSYSTSNGTIPTDGGVYNRNGRAYPDVAAVGNNGAMIYFGNTDTIADGTSMSAPIVAAIFTRINDERLAVGKKPIGFVNPTLYANPQMFHDITLGDQSMEPCGTKVFFSCAAGWDPVTGLGTPKYDAWLKVFMALP
jgi:tripeptidyl-peptidase I